MLYEATITEVREPEKVCKVNYEKYNEAEERSWMELCPVSDRRLSSDDRYRQSDEQYRQNRRSRLRPEGHWQVVICIA